MINIFTTVVNCYCFASKIRLVYANKLETYTLFSVRIGATRVKLSKEGAIMLSVIDSHNNINPLIAPMSVKRLPLKIG